MKIILFLAVIIFTIPVFSQAFMNPKNTVSGNDLNNTPIKKPSIISNAPFADPVDLTEYSYDTIRDLNEINSPGFADAFPWISPDGLRLYYTSGFYNNRLVVAEREDINSFFGAPALVALYVYEAYSYWLSSDELDVYFSYSDLNYGIYYSHRDEISLAFNDPILIYLPVYTGSGVSLNSTQDELFLFAYNAIYELTRISSNEFDYVRALPAPDGFSLRPGQLSKDDLTYTFGAEYNDGKSILCQMTRPTPSDTFDISTFEIIQGINDTSLWNIQPSVSDSLEWVAFVRSSIDSWSETDLYLAHNGILTSIFNPSETQMLSQAFPNPSSEYVYIKYKESSVGSIITTVYSYEGVLVFEDVLNSSGGIIKINTSSWNNGFYCYRLVQTANKKNGAISGKFLVKH